MKQKLLLFFAGACVTLLCSAGNSVRAQSLGLTPAMMDATVKRGASYTNTFTLSNGTGTRLRVRCSVTDYWYDEHNQRVTGRAGSLPRSASSWVQFTPSEFIIEPHSSGSVNAVITVPQGANGGYYTSPTFETENADAAPPAAAGTMQASIKIRFQGLLLLTTEDATEYNVEIMAGQISPPTDSSPLKMSLDVRNRSTAHARVHGVFAVLDASGKLAGHGEIEERRYMPGQRDFFKTDWAGELRPGRYTALVTLTYARAGMTPATLVYELPFEVGGLNPVAQITKAATP
jgi:hypothetical protein